MNLPNGSGQFVCPDGVYTSGNLGKGWAELDLVPYRLTARAGNAAPTSQTYTIAYAVDREQTGAAGYDVLSAAVVNSTLSVGTCPAPVVGSEELDIPGIGGIDKTLYRTLTITQQRNSTCVYDFYARLALGSHLFPGSSLHANLALVDGGDLDTGGIGARDVSIPVNEVEPQSIDKDMTGSRGSDHTWNITKQVAPASLSLADTCDVAGDYASVSVDETITWTKNAAVPGAATLTTNVYATNPASRSISVTVTDVMYAGTDDSVAIDDTTFATVVVPARATLLVGTHTFVWTNPTTTQVNDRATATYVDVATGVTIPGDEEATASATIQDNGPVDQRVGAVVLDRLRRGCRGLLQRLHTRHSDDRASQLGIGQPAGQRLGHFPQDCLRRQGHRRVCGSPRGRGGHHRLRWVRHAGLGQCVNQCGCPRPALAGEDHPRGNHH